MRSNVRGIISLACGIGAVLTAVLVVPGMVLAIAAVLFGVASMTSARHKTASTHSNRVAVAGILTATLALVLCCAMLATALLAGRGIFGPMARTILNGMAASRMTSQVDAVVNTAVIAGACRQYAAAHQGEFPPTLAAVMRDGLLPAERAKAPSSVDEEPADKSFVYVGSDLKLNDAVSPESRSLIVAYSGDWFEGRGLAVSFADGNARFVDAQDVPTVFARSNNARRSLGLRELVAPAAGQHGTMFPTTARAN